MAWQEVHGAMQFYNAQTRGVMLSVGKQTKPAIDLLLRSTQATLSHSCDCKSKHCTDEIGGVSPFKESVFEEKQLAHKLDAMKRHHSSHEGNTVVMVLLELEPTFQL